MFYKFKKNHRSTSTLQKSLTDVANLRQKHNQINTAKFHKISHGLQNVQKLQFANIVKVMNRKNKINLHSQFSEPRYANRGNPKICAIYPLLLHAEAQLPKMDKKIEQIKDLTLIPIVLYIELL